MRTSIFLAGMLVSLGVVTCSTAATQHPVKPEAGPWMILVQSYAGDASATLADELCTSLRRDYKVASYVFDRGEEERQKERERIAEQKRKMREQARAAGLPEGDKLPPVKTYHIESQYAVLIGGWKDQETARKALDEVRKLKPPADKFQHKEVVLAKDSGDSDFKMKTEGINPFRTAFVVRNPTVPLPADPEKGKLVNLKEYNQDESYSLLKCRKPFTLVVKSYAGAVQVASATGGSDGLFKQLGGGNKPGQLLNASAQQAHALADALKLLKDGRGKSMIGADVYVLHTEHSSYVTIGGFEKPDDPQLKQLQKTLAGLQFGTERLMLQPMPMPVPKP